MSRAPRSSPEMFVVQSNGRSARLPILGHDIPSDLSDDDIAGIGEGEGDDDELDDEELDESLDESGESSRFDNFLCTLSCVPRGFLNSMSLGIILLFVTAAKNL